MSDSKPDPKDEPIPPKDEPTNEGDIRIVIDDENSKLDESTKKMIQQLIDQNKDMSKTIQEMNTREQLGLRDTLIAKKLAELEAIRPDLVADFKDEKDIGKLENVITVAKKLTSKYPDIKLDDKGEPIKPPTIFTSIDPITHEPRAD